MTLQPVCQLRRCRSTLEHTHPAALAYPERNPWSHTIRMCLGVAETSSGLGRRVSTSEILAGRVSCWRLLLCRLSSYNIRPSIVRLKSTTKVPAQRTLEYLRISQCPCLPPHALMASHPARAHFNCMPAMKSCVSTQCCRLVRACLSLGNFSRRGVL